jgi:SAM-dependent methyltransferase
MIHTIDSVCASLLGVVFQRIGYKPKARPFSEFINFKETLKAAKAAGVSVGEFIERKHQIGTKSALQLTIEGMESLGVFDSRIDRVCEIGPGSGRYLEITKARCKPTSYEIYETSKEWKDWLVEQYGVTARQADGIALDETATASVDLVQAHKLFPGLPFLTTLFYFREIARVTRAGGWIVFDVMTEECFDKANVQAWFDANPWKWDWSPRMCARQYVLDMFGELEVVFVGSFRIPLHPGVTECMVFRKCSPMNHHATTQVERGQ